MTTARFFNDWPAEDYPQAVEDCLWALKTYLPKRNLGHSYRLSARNAIDQARYLGVTRVGALPPTRPHPARRTTPTDKPGPGQLGLF